mmetsp:Transcript_5535/g.8690  ORF Transcript_5535/g.8690 Transcript_5535/m.8690 type:complete len:112 (+) Transcript_5535:2045-2380(+)
MAQITDQLPEQQYFMQKSTLCIFRYEDVIFTLFQHLAQWKRRATTKETFQNNDPYTKSPQAQSPSGALARIDEHTELKGASDRENSRIFNASKDPAIIDQQSMGSNFGLTG